MSICVEQSFPFASPTSISSSLSLIRLRTRRASASSSVGQEKSRWKSGVRGRMRRPVWILLLAAWAAAALHLADAGASGGDGFPAMLTLERALPMKGVSLKHLRARDRARHGRSLQGGSSLTSAGVVDFPVEGSSNPLTVGLYYTRVKLGNPIKEFYVQIDTGSDILWVTCNGCNGCPISSGLNIQLEFFDPYKSSTSSWISCSDNRCTSYFQSGEALCPNSGSSNTPCSYTFQYGDGSGTSGYYVSDTLYFDTVLGNEQSVDSSATVVFGSHYNLNLESISVNGQILSIDPSVFLTSNTQGTIIDSGTTLAYLAEEAYDPFVNAIVASLSPSVRLINSKGNECFITSGSVDESFPSLTLNFKGGASMPVKPEDYLLQEVSIDNSVIWCIGWQKNQGSGITILGDLVLKDKIFVYDLANQRLGWTSYDCSLSVNVSISSVKNQYLNTGQFQVNKSSQIVFGKLHWSTITFALFLLSLSRLL
ncbi:aspartic proteinase 36-like isoform X2 [Zingiber officinale]|uniref:aspartic proteinase 36-like isoform X2 n=1 Tax=Zingiber officinale TaxID=94328 RepID=UPI001C4BB219|nr:aspartic proteinase 36-like isoform X2 [Zingiber officinale]